MRAGVTRSLRDQSEANYAVEMIRCKENEYKPSSVLRRMSCLAKCISAQLSATEGAVVSVLVKEVKVKLPACDTGAPRGVTQLQSIT